ncbi:unnamed protein product [Discosporangium mesarthrocarpum]
MLYVSMVEICVKPQIAFADSGMTLVSCAALLARKGEPIIREDLSVAEESPIRDAGQPQQPEGKHVGDGDEMLVRVGVMTAVAIGIHNFPEGLATFVAALSNPSVGIALAVAIAIHNIPEGLCVAIPVYYATGRRWKAFVWAFPPGISEPLEAGLG